MMCIHGVLKHRHLRFNMGEHRQARQKGQVMNQYIYVKCSWQQWIVGLRVKFLSQVMEVLWN